MTYSKYRKFGVALLSAAIIASYGMRRDALLKTQSFRIGPGTPVMSRIGFFLEIVITNCLKYTLHVITFGYVPYALSDIDRSILIAITAGPRKPDRRDTVRSAALEIAQYGANPNRGDHGQAAGNRSQALRIMQRIAQSFGTRLHHVSPSNGINQTDDDQTRNIYGIKDLRQDVVINPVSPDAIISMVDVDYYVHLPDYLNGNPLLLYTFIPETTGATREDYVYAIKDDEVSLTVAGSVTYTHKLWNHFGDFKMVHKGMDSWIYETVSVRLSPDRYLVYYEPVRKLSWWTGRLLSNRPVERLKLSANGIPFLVLDGIVRISYPNCPSAYDLPLDVYAAIQERATMKEKLTPYDVSSMLPSDLKSVHTQVTPLLIRSISDAAEHKVATLASTASLDEHTYVPLPANTFQVVKPTMHATMPPILGGVSFAPAKCQSTALAAIVGRIKNVRNMVNTYDKRILAYVDEFVSMLVPNELVHTGVPYDVDMVREKQDRPSQAAGFTQHEITLDLDYETAYDMFNKAEHYAKVTHPRCINVPHVKHRIMYSRFTYAFEHTIMRTTDWYIFGNNPTQVAEKVMKLADAYSRLSQGDFKRMDGSHGQIARYILTLAYLRYFVEAYHSEVYGMTTKSVDAMVFSAFGFFYETMWINPSGNPDTCQFNSVMTAFTSYASGRDVGLAPSVAYNSIGLVGGDDSLIPGELGDAMTAVATELGYSYTKEIRDANQSVTFLGRIYINPWVRIHNICQFKRTMSKLHLTATHPAVCPLEQSRARKAFAYGVTDPNTPFIGFWSAKYRDLETPKATPADFSYFYRMFPEPDSWKPLWPEKDDYATLQVAAEDMGVTTQTLLDIIEDFRNDPTGGPFFEYPPVIEQASVIAGDVHLPPNADPAIVQSVVLEKNQTNPDINRDKTLLESIKPSQPQTAAKKRRERKKRQVKGPTDNNSSQSTKQTVNAATTSEAASKPARQQRTKAPPAKAKK
jgi:hypothetical protein